VKAKRVSKTDKKPARRFASSRELTDALNEVNKIVDRVLAAQEGLPSAPAQVADRSRVVRIARAESDIEIPTYATEGSAGFDLRADECLEIAVGQTMTVPTGLHFEVPPGFELQIRPRSGFAASGNTIPNSPGTVDSDYRGEVKVLLHNGGTLPLVITRGDRIAQAVLAPVHRAQFEVVPLEQLSPTARGAGGFGSTGK
jgi:dUTP pyrophosphatase